jgi:hypothetical protein
LISRPPFSGNLARPINPSPEVMKVLATSSGSATIVPSCFVSRKTLSPYYSGLQAAALSALLRAALSRVRGLEARPE